MLIISKKLYIFTVVAITMLLTGQHMLAAENRACGECQEREGFIKRDGVKLFFSLRGQGDPTIVFIHGLTLAIKAWNCQTGSFCRTNQTLAVDLRGFGRSDKPSGPYTLDVFADDLNFMFNKLNIKKPVIVGEAFGGTVAMNFAIRYPDNISKLVLVSTTPKIAGPTPRFPFALTEQQVNALIRALSTERGKRELANEQFVTDVCPNKCILDPVKERLVEFFGDVNLDIFRTVVEQAGRQSLIPKLSKIKVPTLIAVGTNDRVIDPRVSLFLRRFIPNSFIQEFLGKGHVLFLTDSKRFNLVLRDFITGRSLLCKTCIR